METQEEIPQNGTNQAETPSLRLNRPNSEEDDAIWINCMIRKTAKGYSIWIPSGAFK